jgi:sugar lactone lactonase YvrE
VASIKISAGSLAVGIESVLATYVPDAGSSGQYGGAMGTAIVTVTAAQATDTIWVVNGNGTVSGVSAVGTALTSSALTGGGTGVAIDGSGNIWSLNKSTSTVVEFSRASSVLSSGYSGAGLNLRTALAIDGGGIVWITKSNNSISALSITGTPVSSMAYATSIPTPTSISVDGSGNLWITNAGDDSVTEMVGVASPVTTPHDERGKDSKLATKP